MTILKRIEELKDLPIAKVRATLTLEDYSAKDISEGLKEAGLSGKKVAFAESFYGYLAEAPRLPEDAKAYIMCEGA